MVQSDAMFEPFPDFRTVRAGELEPFKEISNGVLLLARADVDAGEILRALRGLQLREVNDIDRAFVFGDELFQRLGQRRFGVRVFQRHGPLH